MPIYLDQPVALHWTDPKKSSKPRVLLNRIMIMNLTLVPKWENQLSAMEQKLSGRVEVFDLFKWRGQLVRIVSDMAKKMREINGYMKELGTARADVPLAQVRRLMGRIAAANRAIQAKIIEKDALAGKRRESVFDYRPALVRPRLGPTDGSEPFTDGPSNADLADLIVKLRRD